MRDPSGALTPSGALKWTSLLLLLLAVLGCSTTRPAKFDPAPPEAPEERLLFFALDAVPYDLLADLTDPARGEEALFRGYSRPVPLISSFPATSSVAFAGILEPFGMPRAPGYEAKHFDRDANEITGGGLGSYRNLPFSWRDFFTWRYRNPIKRAFATATPVKSSVREVRWVLERFAESEAKVFHGYVALTDGAAHLAGPDSLAVTMETLDEEIRRLRRARPDLELHVVVYSDHGIAGGEKLANVRQGVERALEEAGYRLRKKIESPRDAVMVPFGLVSSFELYVEPGRGPDAARAVAQVEGVDLCVAPLSQENRFLVAGDSGHATFERRIVDGHSFWRYEAADGVSGGDPLQYLPVVRKLSPGRSEADPPWFPDDAWFDATWDHTYPDALYRMSRTFDLVLHPASAACSTEPGYMFGAATTDWAARLTTGPLEWTHGALTEESTLGFLLTDIPGWEPPSALRFDEALVSFIEWWEETQQVELARR